MSEQHPQTSPTSRPARGWLRTVAPRCAPGEITGVACSRKIGPYCAQVCAGVFASTPLTGKNSSAGLRST